MSGCDDSAIESLFATIDCGSRKYEDHCNNESMVTVERRQKRDPSKRKSVTFADCQEVLEMSE